MQQQSASKICVNDGQGVLFILDGWDEIPANLHGGSVFHEMIQPSFAAE